MGGGGKILETTTRPTIFRSANKIPFQGVTLIPLPFFCSPPPPSIPPCSPIPAAPTLRRPELPTSFGLPMDLQCERGVTWDGLSSWSPSVVWRTAATRIGGIRRKAFVEAWKKVPALLAEPSLAFFRDYLDASISSAPTSPRGQF